ncbi:MAG: SDR family oxidoreductase [SAR202 cluster bacterium]|nr:SDR family oxidoreductase [SAR202 cluster bacterium]
MRLENKVALLTGIGQGMGRATARLFAQEGAKVALSARGRGRLEETASQITAADGISIVVPGDLSKKSEAEAIVHQVINKYGRIDIVYSAAGGNFDPTRKLNDVDEDFFNSTLNNTVNSLYNLAQLVRPIMKDQGGGSIVSVAASFSVRQEGNSAYGAAKSGIIGLSQNLAREFHSDNIRVNCIEAGLFRGGLKEGAIAPADTTLLRIGYPQDIAYTALFLACDESSWITGQTLAVDGGVDAGTRSLWEYER